MWRTSIVFLVVGFVVLGPPGCAQAADEQMRTWTDSTGQHRVQAAFVEAKDGRVWLKKADGTTVNIPLDRLSGADQRWVARQAAARPRATAPSASAAQWPGFRGANRDGKSPDTNLLKEWPEDGPRLLWKATDIGKGWSQVAVVDGTVYVTGDVGDKLMLFAFDLDGRLKWKVDNGANCDSGGYAGARATPTIDGSNLYLLSGTGRLSCFDAGTGKLRWSKEAREFGGESGSWGYAESVLVSGDWAIFKPGGERCIVALNKRTGEPVWTSHGFKAGPEYSSCLAITYGGVPQIVTGTNQGIVAVRAGTGDVLWKNEFAAGNTANCPTPAFGDGYVFWANGYGKGGVCLKLDDRGGASQAYTTRDMVCHHGGYIIDNGYIYGNDDNTWKCLDLKTGEVKWSERAVGKGSICWADGMLYLFSERNGRAALATCSPAGLEIKGQVKVDGEGPSWAHPTVIGGRLYLRYDQNLYCFDVRAS